MKRRWFSKPVFVIDKTPNLDPSKPRTIAQHIMRHEEAGWTLEFGDTLCPMCGRKLGEDDV